MPGSSSETYRSPAVSAASRGSTMVSLEGFGSSSMLGLAWKSRRSTGPRHAGFPARSCGRLAGAGLAAVVADLQDKDGPAQAQAQQVEYDERNGPDKEAVGRPQDEGRDRDHVHALGDRRRVALPPGLQDLRHEARRGQDPRDGRENSRHPFTHSSLLSRPGATGGRKGWF